MAWSTDRLVAGGKTAAYAFSYDDSLSPERGRDLVNTVLLQCDDDFNLIASWFPGVSLDVPVQVLISNPSQGEFLGAQWNPAERPRALTVCLGEFSSVGASPAEMVRSFIVAEVSEMFMLDGGTDWNKAQPNEGNMGESFSKFMAVEFVKQQGIKALPTVNIYGSSYPLAVSQLWLNSARDNFIESSSDDTGHDASTGCGTLFVNFLHYQLGVSIGQISGARGATLAEIYTNLTQKNDGWSTFRDLVDLHYPIDGQYDPPLDNIFPVVDLSAVTAPNIVTWVATGSPTGLAFVQVDKAVPVEIKIALSSDHPAIELQPTAVVRVGELGVFAPFIVHRLPANSSPSIDINLSASYAGRSVSTKVTVIRPEDYTMPPLQLVPKEFEDPCMRHFVEGAPEELVINNFLALFAERPGTTYKWTVDGAKAQINNVPTLLIQALPTAGTKVSVEVVATNSDGLHATGTFSFTTAKATQSLNELAQEIRCRVNHIKNMRQFVPPSDPITRVAPDLTREQLREIETQAARVAREAERIVAGVKKIEALKAG